MILPVVRRTQRDGNEPPSVPFHGADERPPGCAGIARLHANRAVQRPQKAVVVRKAAPLDRDLPRGDDLGKGRDLQRGARQARKVERRGIVLRRVQTVRVRKMGVLQAKLPRPSVHGLHKGPDRAAVRQSQRDGGIVAGVQQQAVEQSADRELLPRLEIERRAFDPDCLLRHGDNGIRISVLRDEQTRQDLCRAGDERVL